MKLPREAYIPTDYDEKLEADDSTAVVYLYMTASVYYAVGFGGKRSKPDFHYRYRNAEHRAEHVKQYMDNIAANEKSSRERRAKANAFEHTLKVGDILYSSWGYDQTNIDYYEVTQVVGKKTVKIREIGLTRVDDDSTHFTAENVVPLKGRYVGEEMLKRVKEGNVVSIASYANAYPWDGTPKYQTAFGYGH
jgi:hypothetical protein